MKRFLRATIVLICILTIQNVYAFPDNSKYISGNTILSIDETDTVVFDISQSVMAGNKVSFPVYIITNDTINALDFSFMFDEVNFSLDTIINLTTYLQPFYNYNAGTVYYTSYSLQDIDHNTNLLTISFNMLGHFLCSDDLDSVKAYLNGDLCSVKVVECLTDAVPENTSNHFYAFPNPASERLNIKCKSNAKMLLQDLKGSIVFEGVNDESSDVMMIDVSQFPKGMYVLGVQENDTISFQKIVLE